MLTFSALTLQAKAENVSESIESDTVRTELPNAVITGTRNQTDPRHLAQTITTIDRETLATSERVNMLPTLSEQVPGLFVTQRGMLGFGVSDGAAGGLNLRGMGGGTGRLMVLIDGHPQYQGIFGHPIGDAYQTLLAERVEVLRGPASMLYGSNAMGGVVNIVTRQPLTNGAQTDIQLAGGSYGTFQAEAANRLRYGKFSSVVALQYARTDNHHPSMDFTQYGGYAKLAYDFSAQWRAYADVNLTHFAASYPGSTSAPVFGARQWINRGVATLVVENHYEKTSGAVSVYHNFGRHKINDGYETGEEPPTSLFRSNDALTGVNWYQSASLFTGNRITLGVDYQHIYGKAWNKVIATGEDSAPIGDEKEDEVAAYADFRQDILSWLTLDAGLRYDHHSQSGGEWIPQGGLVVRPIQQGELRATVSKGFRRPTIREMYFWRPANDELLPERALNYELAWSQRLLDGAVSYSANVFFLKADNLIQTQMVEGRPRNVNTGEAENAGVELQAAWRVSAHWSLNGNYSYLHMKNAITGAPEHKAWFGATFAQRKWGAQASLQYVGRLYTAIGENEKQEDFFLLNASIHFSPCRFVTLWVKGENLLAQCYETTLGYPMPKATVMAGVNLKF